MMATNTMFDAPIDQPDYADDLGQTSYGMGRGTGDTIRDKTSDLRTQATDKLRGFADTGKEQVANSLDGLVTAAREIADKLQDGQFGPIGGYATTAADTLEGWVHSVRDKSVDELVDDGRELVRTQPAIAIGAAVAVGFALSRFLKASGGR